MERFWNKRKIGEFVVDFFSPPYPHNGWKLDAKGLTVSSIFTFNKKKFVPDNPEVFISSFRAANIMEDALMPPEKLELLFNEFRNVETMKIFSSAFGKFADSDCFLKTLEFPFLSELNVSKLLNLKRIMFIPFCHCRSLLRLILV